MSRPISALMQVQVQAVGLDDDVGAVERLFGRHGLSWAPVLGPGQGVLGVISSADLTRFRAQGVADPSTRAWQLCTYRPIVASPDAPAADVARQMVQAGIHHVVVMDGHRLAGVVSSLDFVRDYADRADASAG